MLCQNCGQRVATIHIKTKKNNKEIELHLCEECAKGINSIIFIKKSNDSSDFTVPINMLTSILNKGIEYSLHPQETRKCKVCGMTYDNFVKYGKFGCENCYNEFADILDNALSKIHGSNFHKGKIPKNIDSSVKVKKEIENLKSELAKMIIEEKYEIAAKIRDKIKEYEKVLKEEK